MSCLCLYVCTDVDTMNNGDSQTIKEDKDGAKIGLWKPLFDTKRKS